MALSISVKTENFVLIQFFDAIYRASFIFFLPIYCKINIYVMFIQRENVKIETQVRSKSHISNKF